MRLLGGMARSNSVTFRSDNYQVTCKMNKSGTITLTSRKFSNDSNLSSSLTLLERIPIVRGVVALFQGFVNKKIAIIYSLLIISGFVLPLITGITPSKIPIWQLDLVAIAVFSITILFIKLSEMGKYHSAEHMVGNNFQNNREMTLENVRSSSRIHRHCGTNLVILAVIIFHLIINLFGQLSVNWILLILYMSTGVAYEIHTNDNKILNKLFSPFYFLSGLVQFIAVTSKPSDKHLRVAIEAFNEIEMLENEDNKTIASS